MNKTIEICPECGQTHVYKIEFKYDRQSNSNIPFFGGVSSSKLEKKNQVINIIFKCPVLNDAFTQELEIEASKKILGGVSTILNLTNKRDEYINKEFSDWISLSYYTLLNPIFQYPDFQIGISGR